jgi:hypothetical protein
MVATCTSTEAGIGRGHEDNTCCFVVAGGCGGPAGQALAEAFAAATASGSGQALAEALAVAEASAAQQVSQLCVQPSASWCGSGTMQF